MDIYRITDETTVGEALFVVRGAEQIFRRAGVKPRSSVHRSITWSTCWLTPASPATSTIQTR
jgi:hypothetical protein